MVGTHEDQEGQMVAIAVDESGDADHDGGETRMVEVTNWSAESFMTYQEQVAVRNTDRQPMLSRYDGTVATTSPS